MSGKESILSITVAVLFLLVLILVLRNNAASEKLRAASLVSEEIVKHLTSEEYPQAVEECRGITPNGYERLAACLKAIREKGDLTGYFKERGFRNKDARGEGFLIIENARGRKSFESDSFTLLFNNEEVARGCTTPGTIAPGFTCRLNLTRKCEPGDNLEIRYEGKRAHLKTC